MRGHANGDDTITALGLAKDGGSDVLADLRVEGGAGHDAVTAWRDYGISPGAEYADGGPGDPWRLGRGLLARATCGDVAAAEIADFSLADDRISAIMPQRAAVVPR